MAERELWRARISKLHLRMLNDLAMLVWLDGLGSLKSQPNENLAREFLELFALGEGNYSEGDIRAVARALTGWEGSPYNPELAHFDDDEHDASVKTILGQTGNWSTADVVRIACAQPAAAVHVARRLFRALVADAVAVPPRLLEPLAEAMRVEGDVDVARGIELILHSRLFFSDWCRGKRVKGPVELVIGAIRGCERFDPPPDFIELEGWLARMGQRLFIRPTWRAGLRGSTGCAGQRYSSGPPLPRRWRRTNRPLHGWRRSTGSSARMIWPLRLRHSSSEHHERSISRGGGRSMPLFAMFFRSRKHSLRRC